MSEIQLNTDCEGPTCLNDNAYELSKAFLVNGKRFFKQLSNYDDILYLNRSTYKFIPKDYACGDTLRLLLPFLRAKGLTNKMMELFVNRIETIKWMEGAREGHEYLKNKSVTVFEISTSYAPFAFAVADGIHVDRKNVFCTKIDLDAYFLSHEEKQKINQFRKEIVDMPDIDVDKVMSSRKGLLDEKLTKALDRLHQIFWVEMPEMDCWGLISKTKVMNGARKKEAIVKSLKKTKKDVKDLIYVGDSITDVEAFEYVRSNGGLAISFNGNRYALDKAEIACIGKNSMATALIVDRFLVGRKRAVTELIENWHSEKYLRQTFPDISSQIRPIADTVVSFVTHENKERLITQSNKIRVQVRKEAGCLS